MCMSWLLLILIVSMHGSTMKFNYEIPKNSFSKFEKYWIVKYFQYFEFKRLNMQLIKSFCVVIVQLK